jgi:hypothetical protein
MAMSKPPGEDYARGNSIYLYKDYLIVSEDETRWRVARPIADEEWWVIGPTIFDRFEDALQHVNEEIEDEEEDGWSP